MKRYYLLGMFAILFVVGVGVLLGLLMRSSSSTASDVAAYQHSHQGIAFMEQHLYHAAIDEFEAAIRKSPSALDAWVGLSAIYIRLGDAPKALERAAKAAALARDSVDVQLLVGRAHWLAGNFKDAEGSALRVDEMDPSNVHAAELLLRIYVERGDDEKFQEVIDKVATPTRSIQELAVQFAIRQGKFRRAYALRNEFDRRALESATMRMELALKREPGRLELYPELIRNLVRLDRHEAVFAARRQYRGNASLDLELGKAHWLAGNREEAIRAYARASAGAHKLSAEAALAAMTRDRKHWTEAFRAEWVEKDYFVLAQLEEVLENAEPLEKALIYRYAGLFDQELFNNAAENALAVLKTQPDQFDALMTLGTAYSRLGRMDDAMRYVQQGADRFPQRAEVWARLGQIAMMKGDLQGAAESLQRAASSEPSNASYLYNFGWILDQQDRRNEAASYYERAIASSSLSFEAMNNLALIEASRGRSARALALLDRAVASNPDNDGSYLNRGNYYASVEQWTKALADYAQALKLNPANTLAAVESARTHLEVNRVDIAVEELNAALDIDARAHDAYVLLASAYEKQGKTTEAAAAHDEAKRIKDSD